MKHPLIRVFTGLLLCVMLFSTFVAVNHVSAAKPNCQCLEYFQWKMNLPATGVATFSAADYPGFLANYKANGKTKYSVSKMSPSTSNPSGLNGSMMVWGKNQADAWGDGHIALVRSVKYDSKKKEWTIEFIDANGWHKLKEAKSEFGCTNVAIRELKTTKLDGISFYKVSNR